MQHSRYFFIYKTFRPAETYINDSGVDSKASYIQRDAFCLSKCTRSPRHLANYRCTVFSVHSKLQGHTHQPINWKRKVTEDTRSGMCLCHSRAVTGVLAPASAWGHRNCPEPQKDKTVLLMISTASRISSSLITSGGASLMMSPCVGLARSPLSRSRRHTFQAS